MNMNMIEMQELEAWLKDMNVRYKIVSHVLTIKWFPHDYNLIKGNINDLKKDIISVYDREGLDLPLPE